MSNNGSAITSCSAINDITNGDSSSQFALYYQGAGVLQWMLSDGVLTWNTGIDSDARITERDYFSYPDFVQYGSLTYAYDPDSHVIDKGGSLAAVNIPAAVSTAAYSNTDQVTNWNGANTNPDQASNITSDPSGLALTWSARNQLSAVSGGTTEQYDGLGRRESSTGSATLNFEYDGSTMIGWTSASAGAYNFTTMPGGGAIAGSYTASGTTTTWVPLLDLDGSTIGLVNAANVDSGPATTYTYDPSGNPTASGTANDWPFQYQGMEKEFTDPAPYYYSGGGQFYSPQLVRSLSETGQTSSSGPGGGPSPNQLAYGPGSQGNGSFGHWLANQEEGNLLGGFSDGGGGNSDASTNVPVVPIIGIAEFWASFFEWLFGGSGAPQIPRQLRHGRHPLYPDILGVLFGLIPTEASAMLVFSASGAPPPNVAPLQKPGYMTVQYPEYNYCGPGNNGGTTTPDTTDNCCKQHDDCYALHGLTAENMHRPGQGASAAQQACDQQLCTCVSGLPGASGPYDALMQFGIRKYFRCQ